MKTFFSILGIVAAIVIVSPVSTGAAETVEGIFIIPQSQNRVYLGSGDRAIITLGAKNGVIKGDILDVGAAPEHGFTARIGRCVVVQVGNDASLCEVVKARVEVGAGYRAIAVRLLPGDVRLAPHLFNLLSRTVEPYEPERPVTVYIHDIFDEKNDVTKFSEKIKGEIAKLYRQKGRVTLKNAGGDKGAKLYPATYRKYNDSLMRLMEKEGIDVIITGSYKIEGNGVNLSLLRIDRSFADEFISFPIVLSGEEEVRQARSVVIPYDSVETRDYIPLTIIRKDLQYVPAKDEKKAIIAIESEGDAFREYEMKRAIFNVISPVAVAIAVDGEMVSFTGTDATVPVTKGLHRISAAFRRGYFLNTRESLVLTSDHEINKDVLLDIGRDGGIVVEIAMNPVPKGGNVQFRIFRQFENERSVIKSIQRLEAGRSIDFYKD